MLIIKDDTYTFSTDLMRPSTVIEKYDIGNFVTEHGLLIPWNISFGYVLEWLDGNLKKYPELTVKPRGMLLTPKGVLYECHATLTGIPVKRRIGSTGIELFIRGDDLEHEEAVVTAMDVIPDCTPLQALDHLYTTMCVIKLPYRTYTRDERMALINKE